jgi:hypothetical protein
LPVAIGVASALDELRQEVGALLAVDDAGEGAVLPLDEHARVQQYGHEELRLALGEAERGERRHALLCGQFERPAIGFVGQQH